MTELPTENEIDKNGYYSCQEGDHSHTVIGRFLQANSGPECMWSRLAGVAVYRPEPAEPQGLGAVIRDGNGASFVRDHRGFWQRSPDVGVSWSLVQRPIAVLSEGWQG